MNAAVEAEIERHIKRCASTLMRTQLLQKETIDELIDWLKTYKASLEAIDPEVKKLTDDCLGKTNAATSEVAASKTPVTLGNGAE